MQQIIVRTCATAVRGNRASEPYGGDKGEQPSRRHNSPTPEGEGDIISAPLLPPRLSRETWFNRDSGDISPPLCAPAQAGA